MAKWINCKQCGHEFSSSLSRCPECGKGRITLKNAGYSLTGIAFCAIIIVGLVLGFTDKGKTDPIKTASSNSASATAVSSSKTENEPTSKTESSKETDARIPQQSKVESTAASSGESSETAVSKEPTASEADSSSQTPTAASYPTGTIIKNDLVYTTVPKYYLDYVYNAFELNTSMSFDEFAYTLDDEDKAYGYTRVIRNADGSATMVLPWSKLNDVVVKRLTESLKYIKDTENQGFIKKIGHTEKFDKFKITLNTDEMNDEQKSSFVLFGLYFLEYQYCSRDGSDKCELVFVFPDSSEETLSFPDAIK